jgi:transposase-like protein
MDTAVKPVQTGRGRRRRWSAEQKLIVLQEWQPGIPLEEICRKYAMNAAQMYRWKRSLDQSVFEAAGRKCTHGQGTHPNFRDETVTPV